jgi:NADH-quinone oxidoreductase subunit C
MRTPELAARLRERFQEVLEARGEVTLTVAPDELLPAIDHLRDQPDLSFGFLSDLTCTDWPGLNPRFWMAYHLLSLQRRHRVRVKVGLPPEGPRVSSIVSRYPAANWLEREVYDFFGVVFVDHPDLRRIEMPENWAGHPLRKDYPLGGVNTPYKGGAFIPPVDRRGT